MARLSGPAGAIVASLLLLSLSSCSYNAFVDAAFINGGLGFVLAPGQRDPGTHCLVRLVLSNEAGETIWELESPPERFDGCEPWLPLLYGQAPAGAHANIAARSLRTEVAYVLYGQAGESIQGAFVLHRRGATILVENLDPTSERAARAQAAANNWQDEQSGRAFENANRPQNEIVEGPFQDRPLPAQH